MSEINSFLSPLAPVDNDFVIEIRVKRKTNDFGVWEFSVKYLSVTVVFLTSA